MTAWSNERVSHTVHESARAMNSLAWKDLPKAMQKDRSEVRAKTWGPQVMRNAHALYLVMFKYTSTAARAVESSVSYRAYARLD